MNPSAATRGHGCPRSPLLVLVLVLGLALHAAGQGGQGYISLQEWAARNQFSCHWQAGGVLQLSGRAGHAEFVVTSRQANINGVRVWLLNPLIGRNGAIYVSQIDADDTLRPLLFPAHNTPGAKVRTICIDAGHGGNDPGEMVGPSKEKNYTLLLARELRSQLLQAGFGVVMTRNTDVKIELANRPAIAQRAGADMFVCLHFNATSVDRDSVHGIETYALTPAGARSTSSGGRGDTGYPVAGNRSNDKNVLLAFDLQRSTTQRLAAPDRGVRRARFEVLRDATVPAILIEGGYMTHPDEGRKINDPVYRRAMAHALVAGIQAYKQTVERVR